MKCDIERRWLGLVNVNKLKGKIIELGRNVESVASSIGIDRATFYRKLATDGETFTIGEADAIARELRLTRDEVNDIFFAQYVA